VAAPQKAWRFGNGHQWLRNNIGSAGVLPVEARISAATWTAEPLVRPVFVQPSDTAVDAVDAFVPLQIPYVSPFVASAVARRLVELAFAVRVRLDGL
jgi:hypothetical protein